MVLMITLLFGEDSRVITESMSSHGSIEAISGLNFFYWCSHLFTTYLILKVPNMSIVLINLEFTNCGVVSVLMSIWLHVTILIYLSDHKLHRSHLSEDVILDVMMACLHPLWCK